MGAIVESRRGHRVAVTGLGPITSIGSGADSFWEAVIAGRSGVRSMDLSWSGRRSFRSRIGAPVGELAPSSIGVPAREVEHLDPATRFALAAARLAILDAGLEIASTGDAGRYRIDGVDPSRAGVILGTGIGGLCTLERSHRAWIQGEPLIGTLRFSLPMLIPNALPAQVAIRYGLRGECKSVSTACASGTMAIGDAFRLIRDGVLDLVIAGGAENTLSDFDGFGFLGFDLLKTLSVRNGDPEHASRPFDADRDGFVMSEGAGLVVLEREAHALARGARIHAFVAGYAASCDAHSMMQIDPGGEAIVRVMRDAIADAELSPTDIGYVNAHGTSTRRNDAVEASALRETFGRRVRDVLVNSTKAMTGHAIGAAGGIEAIVTAMTLARGIVHRCVNLERRDPQCDLALPDANRNVFPDAALSNSFAFGGHNASLVLVRS